MSNNAMSNRLNINNRNLNLKSGNNNILFAILISIVIIIIMSMFFSKTVRVYRVTNNMNLYIRFQNMNSMKLGEIKDYKLADFYVASSFNSALVGFQLFDYVSADMVKKIMQTGCRFLDFQIFPEKYSQDSQPIVSSGYKVGEWKLTLNLETIESVFKTIADNAFTVFDGADGTPNYLDPIFINLDLKTNYNYLVNNRLQKLFLKYFRPYLLDPGYNYQAKEIGTVPLKDLMGKVIIFAGDGFQGSTLEEIVNYSWNFPKLKRLTYNTIQTESNLKAMSSTTSTTSTSTMTMDQQLKKTSDLIQYDQLKKFNKTGLTMITPHKEGDILTSNKNPLLPWSLGCQFVMMNFQKVDSNMDIYINKFKKKAFVLKPKELRDS